MNKNITDINILKLKPLNSCKGCNLQGVDLSGADLRKTERTTALELGLKTIIEDKVL